MEYEQLYLKIIHSSVTKLTAASLLLIKKFYCKDACVEWLGPLGG
jgi:hypothetical protein